MNVIAASIIALFQDTLSSVIALAVFLPIISDMSGCSGNQAVAVSMRELSLGLIRPNELLRVWLKEFSVGLINGAVLGLMIAMVAFLWKGNPYLGLVVGLALGLNTLIAVSLGGIRPADSAAIQAGSCDRVRPDPDDVHGHVRLLSGAGYRHAAARSLDLIDTDRQRIRSRPRSGLRDWKRK